MRDRLGHECSYLYSLSHHCCDNSTAAAHMALAILPCRRTGNTAAKVYLNLSAYVASGVSTACRSAWEQRHCHCAAMSCIRHFFSTVSATGTKTHKKKQSMASSGKNISAAVLLIIIVIAVLCSMPTCTQGECQRYGNGWCECRHLSGTYSGPCFDDSDGCNEICLNESSDNIYGKCDDNYQCSCYTKCTSLSSETVAVASAPK